MVVLVQLRGTGGKAIPGDIFAGAEFLMFLFASLYIQLHVTFVSGSSQQLQERKKGRDNLFL